MHLTAVEVVLHLLAPLLAGGIIGIERSLHGRPAGFRTHALVCVASSVLMYLSTHAPALVPGAAEAIRLDPTRMAQGIVTGIGFLGAGVIFREGLTLRGLTTAASIWMTSAIGILMGAGLVVLAGATTGVALGVLAGFRWLEAYLPVNVYATLSLRFEREELVPEGEVRALLEEHGFRVSDLSYRLADDRAHFEYRMVIRTRAPRNLGRLSTTLVSREAVREFRIQPSAA